MSRREYEQIDVKRSMSTKDEAKRLARLLTLEGDGTPVPVYQAVHQALSEAIERREKRRTKRKTEAKA